MSSAAGAEERKDGGMPVVVSKHRLVVDAARDRSKDTSVVEMSSATMEALDVFDGDFVEVRGKMKRSMIGMVQVNEEVPRGATAMNEVVRKNLRVKLSDMVSVHPVEIVDATRVQVAAIEETVQGVTGDLPTVFLKPYFDAFPGGRPLKKGDMFRCTGAMKEAWFKVLEVESPNGVWGRVRTEPGPSQCMIACTERPITREEGEAELNAVGYADIGGLSPQLQQIRELVELPIRHPKLFSTIGVKPPKGVLMHGPPGCGKTMIARAIASETGAYFFLINGPEIISAHRGESEKNLRDIFKQAEENTPAIIFVDELDAIAPNRDKVQDETMRRVVATMLTLMDGLKPSSHVMVIGATNRPNSLDPALRRSGRFDAEIVIPVPSRQGRLEILQIVTRNQKKADDVNLEVLADRTHGYVGADLTALAMKAAVTCIRRCGQGVVDMEEEDLDVAFLDSLRVTMADFEDALRHTGTSITRDVVVETPNISFADIGGLEDVKVEMREMIEMPVKHAEFFEDMGILPPKGALMYGPPGCGKTLLAKAIASECNANFISIKGPQLLTKWFGESEENVRDIFNKARMSAPCVLFFDELDAIAQVRGHDTVGAADRVVNQLLTEMDGMEQRGNVFVIGATNRPDTLDPAILRPGRLDQLIYIPLPDKEARLSIFRATLRKARVAPDVHLERLAEDCDKFTGADIAGLCQLAVKVSVRDRIAFKARGEDVSQWAVSAEALEVARKNTRRSISDVQLQMYAQHSRNLQQQLGSSSTLSTVREHDVTGRYRKAVESAAEAEAEGEDFYS